MKRILISSAIPIIFFGSTPGVLSDVFIMPGPVSTYSFLHERIYYGISLKTYDFDDDWKAGFNTWELDYHYSHTDVHTLEIIGPKVLGFFAPGVQWEHVKNREEIKMIAEIDFFTFPFVYIATLAFSKPLFYPSIFVRLKTGFKEIDPQIGCRLSFPLYSLSD